MSGEAEAAHGHSDAVPMKAWFGLGILLFVTFLAFLDRQVISLMVGGIKADLHLTDSQIGVIQGVSFGLATLIFSIPFGYLADRIPRRFVLCIGVVIWSLSAAAGGLATSYGTLMAARIGVAIGEAALLPAASSLIADIFPRHKLATVFSIFNCGTILGGATAYAIGGAVLKWAGDGMTLPTLGHLAAWQIGLMVTGLPGVLIAVLVLFIPEPSRARRADGQLENQAPWSAVLSFMRMNWAYLACYVLGFACLYAATNANLAWFPTVLQRSYGMSIGQLGLILAIFTGVLGVGGQLTNGSTVDRMMASGRTDAHLRYYVYGAIIVAISAICAQFAPNFVMYLALFAPIKFLMNYAGVQIAALQLITPTEMRGRVAGIMGVVYSLVGGTIGPSIVAFFTDNVFHDEAKAINSLSLTYAILAPSACILFMIGLKPMRQAVARLHARDAAEAS